MCSISTNATFNEGLKDIGGDKKTIIERLFNFANEADVGRPGALDKPANHMHSMPPALRDVRKERIGRHRIYYTGHHNQCSYRAFYIKTFKKDDVDTERDKAFQERLKRVLSKPSTHQITREDEKSVIEIKPIKE